VLAPGRRRRAIFRGRRTRERCRSDGRREAAATRLPRCPPRVNVIKLFFSLLQISCALPGQELIALRVRLRENLL